MSTQPPGISPPPLKRARVSLPLTSSSVEPPSIGKKISHDAAVLRLFSWNINGITPFLSAETPRITNYFSSASTKLDKGSGRFPTASLRDCLRRWEWPHVVCLQEVKIASSDLKTQAAVRRSVNTLLDGEVDEDITRPLYDACFCLPQDKHNATGFGGKMYGVCTLVKRGFKDTNFKTVQWDLEGRVLIYEIPSLQVAAINVYAVNGTDYDYRDSKTGKVIGTRHSRKREFHTLLADEVRKYELNGWLVVLAGDINVSRTKNDSFPQLRMGEEHVRNRVDFEEKFMVQLGMFDTYRFSNNETRKYTYRPPNKPWGAGGDRVDMILATRGLECRISKADILDTETERGPSDHVPHFVELNI